MPNLKKVEITFRTHNENRHDDTILHVFVKNRSNTSSTPEQATDFIANKLSYESYEKAGPWDKTPYLARAESLAQGIAFDEHSSHTFEIPLRSTPIPLEEVVLPVVNIHILPDGQDQWIFDYTIMFFFEDGRSFSTSSNINGLTGIILDQDNRNYSGICVENPYHTLPPSSKHQTEAVLNQVCLEFFTHGADDTNSVEKKSDTQVNVHIVNRLNASSSQDIAIGVDLLHGQAFAAKTTKRVVFSSTSLPLASTSIRLQDIVLPVVFLIMIPQGDDRWAFDYQVTYTFSNGQSFSSRTSGIILDQDNQKYAGVYQGRPFPTVTPPGMAPLSPINPVSLQKVISLGFLQKKLNELVNNRQGVGSQDLPLWKIRLHNTGAFGSTLPESYYDVQSITANPPHPGVLSPSGFKKGVTYNNAPTSLGPLTFPGGNLYFNNINSQTVSANIDATQATPLTITVDFDCSGSQETLTTSHFLGEMNFLSFSLQIHLTLTFDKDNARIDVMSVPMEQLIQVNLVTSSHWDLGDRFRDRMRQQIFDTFTTLDPFDRKTLQDKLNAMINSWLLGGTIDHPTICGAVDHRNVCKVQGASIDGNNLKITYTGPQRIFVPPIPAGWPSATNPTPAYDFSPGNLAHIDHIVVLTMENRSFDHMLGYLSLPLEKGGMGRKDVDGLKGTEFNLLNGGISCPSFALPALDTIFAPDPPHGYEPVHKAINGGKMDGFVQSYADEHGPTVAPRIMGHHTVANVPVYDALVRDFALCHRWFASHPGPTFCNRFYELTGRLNIDPEGFWEFDNSSPLRPVFTPTIFDHLSGQNVSWKYFEHHYGFLRFFQHYTFDTDNIVAFDDPVSGFVNLARTGNLPSVSFIDPHFVELPPDANCDGPPADVKDGQELARKVVEAVVTSPKWNKTLLIITYDEHGGFYDHVPPPAATKVSPEVPGTYGVRVPTFVISPWVKGGMVFGHDGVVFGEGGVGVSMAAHGSGINPLGTFYFDHTSILKTIARRFMSQNPPYMGARYAQANDLSSVIGSELHSSQFLPFISYTFVYAASQKCLDVQWARVTPGTLLWQYDPNGTIAQQFSFEDAGNGYFYVRTHTGNLYLTANDSLGVIQDVKYPTDGSATAVNNPDRQLWKFTANRMNPLDRTTFAIWNAAFPGKVLQPSGKSHASGIAVVLGDPEAVVTVLQTPNPWHISNPLLPNGSPVFQL